MWKRLTEPNCPFGDSLWLVTPNFPQELKIIWLAMAPRENHPHTTYIPITLEEVADVIAGLEDFLPLAILLPAEPVGTAGARPES